MREICFIVASVTIALALYLIVPFRGATLRDNSDDKLTVIEPICAIQTAPEQLVEATFQVRNDCGEAVRIVGVESSCGCVENPEFPIEIAPGQVVPLTFHVVASALIGDRPDRHDLQVFVDHPLPRTNLQILLYAGQASGDRQGAHSE